MKTWILLRGLTRESRHWGDFPEILRQTCGDAVVRTVDLPGNGSLNQEDSPLHVIGMAENCRAQLHAGNIAPPYYLLAMSLGAMVAVAWANAHPEEIGGCVLINTSLRQFSPLHHRLRPRNYLPLLSILLPGRHAAQREKCILRLTSNHPAHPAMLAAWAAYADQQPVSSRNAARQLLAAARYEAPPVKPPPPMLVLGSAQDRLVNPCCSRRLARRWGTDYAEHPDAGHDLPLDDGSWVAREVSRWSRNLPQPG